MNDIQRIRDVQQIREALAYYSAGLGTGPNSSRRLTAALAALARVEAALKALEAGDGRRPSSAKAGQA